MKTRLRTVDYKNGAPLIRVLSCGLQSKKYTGTGCTTLKFLAFITRQKHRTTCGAELIGYLQAPAN